MGINMNTIDYNKLLHPLYIDLTKHALSCKNLNTCTEKSCKLSCKHWKKS